MSEHTGGAPGVWLAIAVCLGVGCGGGGGSADEAACEGGSCPGAADAAVDAGDSGPDAPADESAIWDAILAPDAGLVDSGLFGGDLEVGIDIQGQNRACGRCAVLLADIRGGMPPYELEWGDASLEGYGPHEVCTDESVEYTLRVTDSGADGEFAERQTAEASVTAACEEREEEGFSGCKVLLEGTIFTALEGPTDAQLDKQYACEELDGSEGTPGREVWEASMDTDAAAPIYAASGMIVPDGGFRAGESYQLSLDLLFGFQLGGDIRAELWGSDKGCSKDEKLGELRMRTEDLGHASVCITPEEGFEKVLMVVREDTVNPLFGFNLGASFAACTDCD